MLNYQRVNGETRQQHMDFMFFFFSNNPWWVLKNCLHGDLPSINRFFFVNIYHAVSPKLNTLVVINTRILIGSNLDINFFGPLPRCCTPISSFCFAWKAGGRSLASWQRGRVKVRQAREQGKPSEFQNDESFGSVSSHRDSSANHPTTHLKSCYFHGSLDWLQGSWEKKQKNTLPSSDLHPDTLFWHGFWHITYHVDIYMAYIFWHSIWHVLWNSSWHSSGILFGTYSDILSGIIWHLFWYSLWHLFWHSAFYLAVFLAFYLTYLLTFCLEFYLAFSLAWVRVQAQSWAGDLEFGSRHAPQHPGLAIWCSGGGDGGGRREGEGVAPFLKSRGPSPDRWGITGHQGLDTKF